MPRADETRLPGSACDRCGASGAPGARFCAACGAPLPRRCAACGEVVTAEARFCSGCGNRVEDVAAVPDGVSLGAPAAERRQVTVLYCDLVDSTSLAQHLDPELFAAMLRAYQEAARVAVHRYGGHVAQYLGDGLLIYFGYPDAHEDNAERAVHAALTLLGEIEVLDRLWRPRLGWPLALRIGIDTGLVLIDTVGEGSRSERLALGETPNVAARLQALARPGSVVISERTLAIVAGAFEVEDLGPQLLKGLSDAQRIARVRRPLDHPSRFEARLGDHLTPLVGRHQEIGLLLDRWTLACEGDGQVVMLSADPGIGKSRLLHELRAALGDTSGAVLRFQCSPHHVNSAYFPLITHLESALKLRDDMGEQARRDAFDALVGARFGLRGSALEALAHLLSLPAVGISTLAPERVKELTLAAAVELTLATARSGSSLLLFEDAHWADPTTVEFLDLLIRGIAITPMLLVVTHRPEFHSAWHRHGHVTAIALSHLGRSQASTMVSRLSAGLALPSQLVLDIVEKAGGVPLFIEEVTKAVLESRMVASAGEADGAGAVFEVPTTLRDSLMSRLDRLPAARDAAQIGAVIGREFDRALLEAVADVARAHLARGLDDLVAGGLAFRRGSGAQAVYTFKHALIQDVAYDSMPRSRRQVLHRATAAALESLQPKLAAVAPEILAHHLTEAAAPLAALPLWLAAAHLALRRTANAEAIAHATRGLELLATVPRDDARDDVELDLRDTLGVACMALYGWASPRVAAAFEPALALASARGRHAAQASVSYGWFAHLLVTGRVDDAVAWAEETAALASPAQHGPRLLMAELMLLIGYCWAGRWPEARTHAERLEAIYSATNCAEVKMAQVIDPRGNLGCYSGHFLWALGRVDQAVAAQTANVASSRAADQPFLLGFATTIGALTLDFVGDAGGLAECAREAMAVGQNRGLPLYSDIMGPCIQALAILRSGRYAEAAEALREGIERWSAWGAAVWTPYLEIALADAERHAGRVDVALAAVERALARIERLGERAWQPEGLRVRGLVLAALGRRDDALASLEQAAQVADAQGAPSWALRAATSCARLLLDMGEHARARQLLAPRYAAVIEGLWSADLRAAAEVLALLDGQSGTGA